MALCYFFFFIVFGLTMPYLTPVLLELGFSKRDAGLILGMLYLCNTLMPVVFGRISDKYGSIQGTIRFCSLMMTVFCALLWWQAHQPGILFLGFLFAMTTFSAPLISLQDALAMEIARDNPKAFSRLRMIGSLGFAFAVILFGYVADWFGMLAFFAALWVACFMFSIQTWRLPNTHQRREVARQTGFWRSLSLSWWLWLLALMGHWFCFGPYHYGFTLLLEEQGLATNLFGWFWSIGVAVEILLFLLSGWFFSRWSYKTLLGFAFIANLARWILLGLFPNPWIIALSQILHGPGFALFYAAAIKGIGDYCGGTNRASYQGLFSTMVGGLASILGIIAAGWLHERMPLRELILWFVPIQALSLFLLLSIRLKNKTEEGIIPAAHL